MCPHPSRIASRLLAVLLTGTTDNDRERGGGLVEYCLLVGLIALVTVGALGAFGAARDSMYERSASSMFGP